jgi:hypothetical protein
MAYLLLVHVTGAERADEETVRGPPLRIDNEDITTGSIATDGAQPWFRRRGIGENGQRGIVKHRLDLSGSQAMLAAFLAIASVPLKA